MRLLEKARYRGEELFSLSQEERGAGVGRTLSEPEHPRVEVAARNVASKGDAAARGGRGAESYILQEKAADRGRYMPRDMAEERNSGHGSKAPLAGLMYAKKGL